MDDVQRRHAEYFLTLAEQAEPELRGSGQAPWIARLEADLPNLRAVLEWSLAGGDVETGLRLAGTLHWFWFLRNRISEGRDWFDRARAVSREPSVAMAKAANGAGMLAWRAGDYAAAKEYGEAALEYFRACGDRWGIAFATHHLGHVAWDLNDDYGRAVALLSDSLEQFEAICDPWGIAFSQRCLGMALATLGDYARAATLMRSSLAVFRQLGDPWNIGIVLHRLGNLAGLQKHWGEAVEAYRESLAHHWLERDIMGVADALLRLAQILVASGDAEQAIQFFGCAEALHEQAGVKLYHRVQPGYDQNVAAARVALSAETFRALWDEGRSLSVEEAIEAAANIRIAATPSRD